MKRQTSNVKRSGIGTGRGASHYVSRLTFDESGYTLVAIVIGMMILAILIMGVAPSVATIMKREREQELLAGSIDGGKAALASFLEDVPLGARVK